MRIEVFSGIQPSGELHLGNYLGAVANWVRLQERHTCAFAVVDLHAMTIPPEPQRLRENTRLMCVDILAAGVDPERSLFFLQSMVPEHTELAWLFACLTPYGWLAKMTQFKDKARQVEETGASFGSGLLLYPSLMAADILLYKAMSVPVGEDQVQHLEFARDVARTFNARYGETFPEPKGVYTEIPRVMSVADPTKKMGKSLGPKHCIGLFDEPASIRKKVSAAVTDTGAPAPDGSLSPGVENLLLLLRAAGRGDRERELRAEYARGGERRYAPLKGEVADALVTMTEPLRPRREALLADPEGVHERVMDASSRARRVARETLADVREKMGLPRQHAS
jgi:tryptophanyl-tRNA synthetase